MTMCGSCEERGGPVDGPRPDRPAGRRDRRAASADAPASRVHHGPSRAARSAAQAASRNGPHLARPAFSDRAGRGVASWPRRAQKRLSWARGRLHGGGRWFGLRSPAASLPGGPTPVPAVENARKRHLAPFKNSAAAGVAGWVATPYPRTLLSNRGAFVPGSQTKWRICRPPRGRILPTFGPRHG